MADSVAVMIASAGASKVATALDLLGAAMAMEMEAHVYFTGDAIVWLRAGAAAATPEAQGLTPQEVAARLRELKQDGTLGVYACSRAMATHGIARDQLAAEVDMPSGFAYFLSLAAEATMTWSF